MRAGLTRTHAWLDFDLYCGNHDLRPSATEEVGERYVAYRKEHRFRTKRYWSVTHRVINLEVRRQDAEEWFAFAYGVVARVENLQRIRLDESMRMPKYSLQKGLIRVLGRTEEGEVVDIDETKFSTFITDLTLDYEILKKMSPRDFERAIAAVYVRTRRYKRVILTPPAGDGGRDLILEPVKPRSGRRIVELKRYRSRRIKAELVNALIGVLYGESPESKATVITTSTFAPRLPKHRSITKAVADGRLQMLDLVKLVEGCIQSEYSDEPDHFAVE